MWLPADYKAKGYHSVTPYLVVQDAAKAIQWYRDVLGATECFRMPFKDGKGVMHAELQIGDSRVMISDPMPGSDIKTPLDYKGTPVSFYLYVPDADAQF